MPLLPPASPSALVSKGRYGKGEKNSIPEKGDQAHEASSFLVIREQLQIQNREKYFFTELN